MSDEPIWLPHVDQLAASYLRDKLAGRKIDLNTMQHGDDHLADAVKVTLGPKGRNVVLDTKVGSPTFTKGGVVVARETRLTDQDEDPDVDLISRRCRQDVRERRRRHDDGDCRRP